MRTSARTCSPSAAPTPRPCGTFWRSRGKGSAGGPGEPHSRLQRWLASHRLAGTALAEQPPDATRAEILGVLERYRRATEGREIQALAEIYEEFTPEQQAAQQRY